jgi:hypothetical protein
MAASRRSQSMARTAAQEEAEHGGVEEEAEHGKDSGVEEEAEHGEDGGAGGGRAWQRRVGGWPRELGKGGARWDLDEEWWLVGVWESSLSIRVLVGPGLGPRGRDLVVSRLEVWLGQALGRAVGIWGL